MLKVKAFGITTAILATTSLIAGGFFSLEIGKPAANPEAQAKHAVLVVRSIGCAGLAKTTITATAEGLVNGKRESVPLKLIPLSSQSTYALVRQWPEDSKRVIVLMGAGLNWQPSLLVKVEGDSVDWSGVTRLSHAPNAQEIEAALNTAVAAKLQ